MKFKEGYKVRDIAGEHVVIMQGRFGSDMTRVIALNETSLLLWNELQGKEFDADLCEAVAKFAAGEEMQGKVVDIVQTGYMLGDKVLRFAKVVVGE